MRRNLLIAIVAVDLDLIDNGILSGELIAINNDWKSSYEPEIAATIIPPIHDKESAILADLFPGNYTAIVRGAGDTTGVGLVEAYQLR